MRQWESMDVHNGTPSVQSESCNGTAVIVQQLSKSTIVYGLDHKEECDVSLPETCIFLHFILRFCCWLILDSCLCKTLEIKEYA